MKKDHLAFLLGGLAFGVLFGFGLFRALDARPGGPATEQGGDAIPSPAGPSAPTQLGGAPTQSGGQGGASAGAPMMAEINALKERVQRDPGDVAAWSRLGGLYQNVGMYAEAAAFYEKAAALTPNDPALLNELGICYQAQRKLEQSLDAFERAQKADPAGWEAVFNAIITESALGRLDAARADLSRLRQMKPDAPNLTQLDEALRQLEQEAKTGVPEENPSGKP